MAHFSFIDTGFSANLFKFVSRQTYSNDQMSDLLENINVACAISAEKSIKLK